MKPFKPEHYYRASLERIAQAHQLYRENESYALSMYTAGVAVECMLRAFKGKRDKVFDERHDLRKLFQASGILRIQPPSAARLSEKEILDYHRGMQVAVEDIFLLWSNDFRFASEERLRSHLKKSEALRGKLRGDILKVAALRLIDACQFLVSRGIQLWPHS